MDTPRCDGAAALVSAPRTSTSRSSTIAALTCGRPMGFCWGALLTKSVRRLDDESVVRAPTRRSLAAFGLCTSAPRIPHAAHMPAQPLGRKGHVLSSTFVGVARQAQWFDEQAGEKTPRCRTIGPNASCSGCASGRLPAAAATTLRSSLPLRVCMPSRVREAEGVGEAVEGDCTGGWRAGCWPRETCGQRRVGEAAAGGALGVLDARRAEGYVGLSTRRAGACTGGRRDGGECGLGSCGLYLYQSRSVKDVSKRGADSGRSARAASQWLHRAPPFL